MDPDFEQTHTFLELLTEGEPITFQTFDDSPAGRMKLAHILHGTLPQHQDQLLCLNQQGAGVYVMVNKGDGKGRSAGNVTGVRAVFVDFDGAKLPSRWDLEPHILVESSPGRYHAYFKVQELPMKEFKPIQKALASHYQGDTSVCDLPRVMRLPGFYHCKREPVHVRLLHVENKEAYTRNDLLGSWSFLREALEPRPHSHIQRFSVKLGGGRACHYAWAALHEAHDKVATAPEGQRNDTLNRAAFTMGQLVGAGALEQSEVEEELQQAALICGLTEGEARTTITSGLKAGVLEPRELSEEATAKERKSQATVLVELVEAQAVELFHDPEHEPYVAVPIDGHREVYRLRSKAFRSWMQRLFYQETGSSAGSQAVQDALGTLEGKARFDGPMRPIHVRLAEHQGKFYLDLANDVWQVVEINAEGWRVLSHSPVYFRRTKGLAPLPEPVAGGDLTALWDLLNVAEEDRPLVAGWLVAGLRPHGPYPPLALHGEQGSAKSTTARALRALIDPSTAPLRSEPRDARDLMIAATNSWCPTFDNMSGIPGWLSDTLCILATGGGYATRTLYENEEETILNAQRPVIMTAIAEIATRPDLLDRCMVLYLPRIADTKRKSESEFWQEFNQRHAEILGALLSAVVRGLRNLPHTTLDKLPRMADFALWVVACEEALGLESSSFMKRYTQSRESANELALDTSPLPPVLRAFVSARNGAWEGTAADLLRELTAQLERDKEDNTARLREWPKRADKLSAALRRLAPNLRATGLELEFDRETTGRKRRIIRLGTRVQAGDTGDTSDTSHQENRQQRTNDGDAKRVATLHSGVVSDTAQSSDTRSVTTGAVPGAENLSKVATGDARTATLPSRSSWEAEL
jgi:hypothetical protein